MTSFRKSTHFAVKPVSTLAQNFPYYSQVSKVLRFIWHFLEMQLAMGAGMAIFHMLESLIPPSSILAPVSERGTVEHTLVMDLFMVVPMVAWMIVRGHGWHHSLEMAVAMIAPIAAVTLLCQLGFDAYLPWLAEASAPAMFLGMLAAMLYRRDHYTGKANHSAHRENSGGKESSH